MASKRKKEFYWENAPLQEVIAEVRWDLQSITSYPGAAIDPFHDVILRRFSEIASQSGFSFAEPRMPASLPIEFQAHKAVRLFRTAPQTWPAYQIGPGVFTANITPPYQGWSSFRPHIASGLRWLFDAHPHTASLRLRSVELRYMNVFSTRHGVKTPAEFIGEVLDFRIKLPSGVKASIANEGATPRLVGEIRIPLQKPVGASGFIVWSEGILGVDPVVSLDFVVRVERNNLPPDADAIVSILDEGRDVVSQWFEAIVVPNLKERLGQRIYV